MQETYFLSEAAEQDIDDAITYLATENVKSAQNFLDALYQAFDQLADNPLLGHLRDDLTNHPVRFWTFNMKLLNSA